MSAPEPAAEPTPPAGRFFTAPPAGGQVGPASTEQLGALVDCVLRDFRRSRGPAAGVRVRTPGLACPACGSFLGDPVCVACGHTYCRRCVSRQLVSRCRLCGERPGGGEPAGPCVLLRALLRRWFPPHALRCEQERQLEELSRSGRYREAVELADRLMRSDGCSTVTRVCRAEAHAGLGDFSSALADMDEPWLNSVCWPEAHYLRAKILQQMGRVEDSLQTFLQCLSLDDEFSLAKKEVEKILCDLLSLASDTIKLGLRETTSSTLPHLRTKGQQTSDQHLAAAAPRVTEEAEPTERHAASSERLLRPGLSRAQSMRTRGGAGPVSGAEDGLKRVSSAPQLSDQDKGVLLKRKLCVSEPAQSQVHSASNKHKRQGESVSGSVQPIPTFTSIPIQLVEASDFECSLCMRLFYQPVTTPCGHTFCKSCLERCLDHTPHCPLCKKSLKQYLACRKYSVTHVLDEIINRCLPAEHAERLRAHTEETRELSHLTKKVPIFVCTMAYPTVPCPLHVFEPRYRLMIRRCMETGTRQFGMCINDPQKGFADYGCMLQIRSVHFLPDGRSVVDTVGGSRFRVLNRNMRDGYCTADIHYLEDVKVDDAEELWKLQDLHEQVYQQACTWFQNLKSRFRAQILQHFGPMPEREADIQATPNGPACCWWLLAVLPVDPRYQLSVLAMLSLRERLLKIQHILTYLQSVPNE